MRKKLVSIALATFMISAITETPSFASVSCPDTWTMPQSSGEITLLENGPIPANFSQSTGMPVDKIQKALDLGQKFLIFKEIFPILPATYYEKIQEGGRNISVVGQSKISTDGKTWRSSVGTNWDLLPINSPITIGSEPRISSPSRLISIAAASRQGYTPGTKVAFELTVNVSGCKQKVFYEKLATVPNYSVETKTFDSLLDGYYKLDPSYKQMNFIEQKSCNETLSTFISHVKQISQKSTTWTISNTNRGVLDLAWSLTAPENSTCYFASKPFMDLVLAPTIGDSCITLKNPGKSIFTYTTLKFPCSVSVDLVGHDEAGSYEVAKFVINKPNSISTKPANKSITCVKGKSSKKVIGTNPKCPAGFKATQTK
jgi:hypothetical protein